MEKKLRNCIVCNTQITGYKYCEGCRKATRREYVNKWNRDNPRRVSKEYRREYWLNNKDRFKDSQKRSYIKRKDSLSFFLKRDEYYNSDKYHKKVIDAYLDRSKPMMKSANKRPTNYKTYLKTIQFITTAVFNNASPKRVKELLGCSIEDYKKYLESKFSEGMNWENRGLVGWHIDHIIPCSKFNLSEADQFKAAFHYSNTQPLWNTDNVRKAKIEYH